MGRLFCHPWALLLASLLLVGFGARLVDPLPAADRVPDPDVLIRAYPWPDDLLLPGEVAPPPPIDGQPWQALWADGTVAARGRFLNGKRHGPWVRFYPDGSPLEQGAYDQDRPVGPWQAWDTTGKRLPPVHYGLDPCPLPLSDLEAHIPSCGVGPLDPARFHDERPQLVRRCQGHWREALIADLANQGVSGSAMAYAASPELAPILNEAAHVEFVISQSLVLHKLLYTYSELDETSALMRLHDLRLRRDLLATTTLRASFAGHVRVAREASRAAVESRPGFRRSWRDHLIQAIYSGEHLSYELLHVTKGMAEVVEPHVGDALFASTIRHLIRVWPRGNTWARWAFAEHLQATCRPELAAEQLEESLLFDDPKDAQRSRDWGTRMLQRIRCRDANYPWDQPQPRVFAAFPSWRFRDAGPYFERAEMQLTRLGFTAAARQVARVRTRIPVISLMHPR